MDLKLREKTQVRRLEKIQTTLIVSHNCQDKILALVEKTIRAARQLGINRVVIAGGVAANLRLREYLLQRGSQEKLNVFIPPREFCTDNAAMIALAGYHLLRNGQADDLDTDVYSRSSHFAMEVQR